MKNIITAFIYMFSITAYSQTWISPEDAVKHNGDTVNVVGLISHVENIRDTKGSSIIMSINGKGSNQLFIVLLLKSDSQKILAYLNQYVQVKGRVELNDGKPQIIINSENQICIAREDHRRIMWEPE